MSHLEQVKDFAVSSIADQSEQAVTATTTHNIIDIRLAEEAGSAAIPQRQDMVPGSQRNAQVTKANVKF